jgi:ABC-2 type transport system ATP-binding protein
MTSALVVSDVRKSYGTVTAINGLSLHVEPGEFVVLLGPNGAGKTTLFQLLSGLFTPDAGQIRVRGHDMQHSAVAALAEIGVVFQQPALDLDLSVMANLRFHTRLHGMAPKATAERIRSELEHLGLDALRKRVCRGLSGGNRRRVELARALLHEPPVLLMDEATVGLDPESRQSLLAHVKEACDGRDLAVLWATHLVDEAVDADRVYVIDDGRLLIDGTPVDIMDATGQATMLDAFLSITGALDSSQGAESP